jgi:DNA transformation protein
MSYEASHGEWVQELLGEGLGHLTIKKMFGAAGVYLNDGLMFALIDDGTLWLRADEMNQPDMEKAGSIQFTYPTKDGEVMTMGYWSLPDDAADDRDEAVRWARRAIEASRRKVGPKKKKPYKGSGR